VNKLKSNEEHRKIMPNVEEVVITKDPWTVYEIFVQHSRNEMKEVQARTEFYYYPDIFNLTAFNNF